MLMLFTVFVLQISEGNGYPFGAPYGTCLTMYPHHGSSVHQQTACPIKLDTDKTTYSPNQELSVTVKSDDDDSFKGIEMRVHRVTGNTEEMLGEFIDYSSDKLQTQSCFFGKNNLVTHKNNVSVANVTVLWKAPAQNVGDIQFTATIVKDYNTFWFGVKAVVKAESATAVVGPSFQLPTISNSFDISLTDCGKSKGCFLHPPSCTGSECNLGVTYQQNQDDTYSFEMFGPSEGGAGWIGLGMSEDRIMGSDQAFICAVVTDYVGIQYSFNPAKYTVQELTQGYSGVETKLADGMIYCRFTRDKLSTIDHKGPVTFDLSKSGFLHLAHGLTYGDLGQPRKHLDNPVISYKSIMLNDSTIQFNVESGSQSRDLSWVCVVNIFALVVSFL